MLMTLNAVSTPLTAVYPFIYLFIYYYAEAAQHIGHLLITKLSVGRVLAVLRAEALNQTIVIM